MPDYSHAPRLLDSSDAWVFAKRQFRPFLGAFSGHPEAAVHRGMKPAHDGVHLLPELGGRQTLQLCRFVLKAVGWLTTAPESF